MEDLEIEDSLPEDDDDLSFTEDYLKEGVKSAFEEVNKYFTD